MGIIRNEFNQILLSLKLTSDKDYLEMIPCVCEICRNEPTPYYHEFNVLKRFTLKGKTYIDCQKSTDSVLISKIMRGYDKIKTGERILEQLIIACSQLQGYHKILDGKEDSRNSFIANVLSNRGIVAKDQSRWGSSPTNISQGEIDIKIENNSGTVLGIFEGFNLSYADTNKISSHLEKIFGYDPNGSDSNYIVVYVDHSNFSSLWKKYQSIAESIDYTYSIQGNFVDISQEYLCGSNIRIGKTIFKINNSFNTVFHIFIFMGYN